MTRPSLSVCMIVKNEAHNLPRSLGELAPFVDQAVVVDTGSTDDTAAMARKFGAEVHRFEWSDDFSAARNASLEYARGDWILWFDADNHTPPDQAGRLRDWLPEEPESILWMTEVLEPGGQRLLQKRIFPNRKGVRFVGRIHEQMAHPDGWQNVVTDVEVFHWGYADKAEAQKKAARNLALIETELATAPDDFYLLYQAGKTLLGMSRPEEAGRALVRIVDGNLGADQNREMFAHAHVLPSGWSCRSNCRLTRVCSSVLTTRTSPWTCGHVVNPSMSQQRTFHC